MNMFPCTPKSAARQRPFVLLPVALACALLAACGAEVAGTAATVGGLQAEQARQAQAQQKQIVDGMKAAEQAAAQRAASAAE